MIIKTWSLLFLYCTLAGHMPLAPEGDPFGSARIIALWDSKEPKNSAIWDQEKMIPSFSLAGTCLKHEIAK